MKKIILATLTAIISGTFLNAQTHAADTVVIKVGTSSKMTLVINKQDLETLKKYDMQSVMNDVITKLEERDTTAVAAIKHVKPIQPVVAKDTTIEANENWNFNQSKDSKGSKYHKRSTYHSFNFDIGTNNYVSGGEFPDQDNSLYTVKPWGSWYVGINSVQRTRLANKFFLEWGFGVSWYNFKFENEQTMLMKDNNAVTFMLDPRTADFKKSKLTASYLNASLVPMIDFGKNGRKPSFFNSRSSESFRFGVGPYAGYRIGSHTKQVFEEDGDEKNPKNSDNFYLNNLRYGVRMQMGFRDFDLFFNYDLNDLFISNKGPQLNAFSFGVTF